MAVTAETLRSQPNYSASSEKYLQAYDDETTWLAETLDGSMRTSFEFTFDGSDFYGRDGRSMRPVFDDAVVDAKRQAKGNPELAFEVPRRVTERAELRDMVWMGQGSLPNTMVVVSDLPAALLNRKKNVGGYDLKRKQTMLRVITMTPDGTMVMQSQSLDHSNRQALEAIYEKFGIKVAPGELLGQRIHCELPVEDQKHLIDRLMGVYDQKMTEQFGGQWYAGRSNSERINTYDFVRTQRDAVDAFIQAKSMNPYGADDLRYDLAACIEKRFKGRHTIDPIRAVSHVMFGQNQVFHEMRNDGMQARRESKSFSGCGITANGGVSELNDGLEDQLKELGYGSNSGEGPSDDMGPLKFKCQNGHENTRPKNKLIDKCKTCKVNVSCKK